MEEDFSSLMHLPPLILQIIRRDDASVYQSISDLNIVTFFSVSWILTWCASDVLDYRRLRPLFRFLESQRPIAVLYFAAALPLMRRAEISCWQGDSNDLYHLLRTLPEETDFEEAVRVTVNLMKRHPPSSIDLSSLKG